ncbi:MAG: tyrosine--tRNA ligase [Minisyncoccia bacterium]
MQVDTDEKKIEEILTRGVENVIPRDLAFKKLQSGEKLRIYFGIDPTGAKLHLGHSVPLRKLQALANLGHHVIFIVGSFTAMIGDPSGRDEQRTPLSEEAVRANFADYKRQAEKILDFSKVEIRYNHAWLAPMTLKELLPLASQFTVQQMLKRDMFQRRIAEDKPISVVEFLYPLMVGYDSATLDVDGELGGSDQEFNMLAGRHVQQVMGKRDKFVLTSRLIEGLDGRKMSKTYDNCVYLEDAPAEMYGKLMSVRDDLVEMYFETCTDVPIGNAKEILAGHPKDAKMRLAREIVTMYHGAGAAAKAEENWQQTFSEGAAPTDAPEIRVSAGEKISDKLVAAQIVSSKTELHRLEKQNAVSSAATGEKIGDVDALVHTDTLRIGKHRFVKIVIEK